LKIIRQNRIIIHRIFYQLFEMFSCSVRFESTMLHASCKPDLSRFTGFFVIS
jgi:hypothetical protein